MLFSRIIGSLITVHAFEVALALAVQSRRWPMASHSLRLDQPTPIISAFKLNQLETFPNHHLSGFIFYRKMTPISLSRLNTYLRFMDLAHLYSDVPFSRKLQEDVFIWNRICFVWSMSTLISTSALRNQIEPIYSFIITTDSSIDHLKYSVDQPVNRGSTGLNSNIGKEGRIFESTNRFRLKTSVNREYFSETFRLHESTSHLETPKVWRCHIMI